MAKIIKSMSKNKVIKFDFFMIIITIKYENIKYIEELDSLPEIQDIGD